MEVEKMEKVEFYKEIITGANITDYKKLIDSIRYICDFNGFDKDFEYDEDIKNPSLPDNGKIENNHFIGFKLTGSGEACVYVQYYEKFNSENTIFLGDFFEAKKFHGNGYGKIIYKQLEDEWRAQGFKHILLNVDLKNTGALLFWIKMGFKTIQCSFQSNEKDNEKFYTIRLSKEI